jgi:hypothetical protein
VIGFPGAGGSASMSPAGPPPTEAERQALLEPPAVLPSSIEVPGHGAIPSPQDFWRQWAPLALEQRTLVPATVPGFSELCELASFKAEVAARLRKFGSQGKEGDARQKQYAKLSQRVDATLGRFKLTAFARPADGSAAKKPAANPFAVVAP